MRRTTARLRRTTSPRTKNVARAPAASSSSSTRSTSASTVLGSASQSTPRFGRQSSWNHSSTSTVSAWRVPLLAISRGSVDLELRRIPAAEAVAAHEAQEAEAVAVRRVLAGEDAREVRAQVRIDEAAEPGFARFLADLEQREQATIVEVADDLAPRGEMIEDMALEATKVASRAVDERVRQPLGAVERDQEPAREDRIDEAERVADERPVVTDAARRGELVVRVLHDRRQATDVRVPRADHRVGGDVGVVLLFDGAPERAQVRAVDDDADRHPTGQRDAPRPAVRQTIDVDVAGHDHRHPVEMREERRVAAVALDRGNAEQVREQAGAAAGVDHEVRLRAQKAVSRRERRVAQTYAAHAVALEDGGVVEARGAHADRRFQERLVEEVARGVVRVARAGFADVLEAKAHDVVRLQHPGRARLVRAVAAHLVLDAELAQEGYDRGHQRLADHERRSLAPGEDRNPSSRAREQRRRERTGRAAADDRDRLDRTCHGLGRTIDERTQTAKSAVRRFDNEFST